MVDAIDKFFPEAGIVEAVRAKGFEIPKSQGQTSFRQSISGMSDLVGANNGKRSGGYVLVIDGVALGYVSHMLCVLYDN